MLEGCIVLRLSLVYNSLLSGRIGGSPGHLLFLVDCSFDCQSSFGGKSTPLVAVQQAFVCTVLHALLSSLYILHCAACVVVQPLRLSDSSVHLRGRCWPLGAAEVMSSMAAQKWTHVHVLHAGSLLATLPHALECGGGIIGRRGAYGARMACACAPSQGAVEVSVDARTLQ